MKKLRKLLVEMIKAYLNNEKLPKGVVATDSMDAEPDERVEIYFSSKQRSVTVLAITMAVDVKIIQVYSEFPANLRVLFSELFKFFGFDVIELTKV